MSTRQKASPLVPVGSRSALRFALAFVAILLTLYSLPYILFPSIFGFDPIARYTEVLAKSLVPIFGLLGTPLVQTGSMLIMPRFSMIIVDDCTGVIESVLFASAVLAYPLASWRWRLIGFLLGTLVIILANYGRIIGLYYLGTWMPELFGFFHLYLVSGLFLLATLGLFLLWLEGNRDVVGKS